jgi:hypothetical protein
MVMTNHHLAVQVVRARFYFCDESANAGESDYWRAPFLMLQEDQEEYAAEEEEQDVFDSDFDDDVSSQPISEVHRDLKRLA